MTIDNMPRRRQAPKAGMLRIAPLMAIPELLQEFGVRPEPLIESCGIAPGDFDNPENLVPYVRAAALIKAGAQATGCPHFGLLLGQRGGASSLGAVGFLMRNAPDVGTALGDLVANLDLHERGANAFMEVTGDMAAIGYEITENGVAGSDEVYETALAIGWKILHALCGPDWRPVEVMFRRDRPADIDVYERFFKAPVHFNAERNCLRFAAACLTRPISQADPLLRRHFEQYLSDLRRHSNTGFHDEAYLAIFARLGSSRLTLNALAAELSLHPRTLNRRLETAGTSFRELYNKARHDLACQLLCDTRSSLKEIARMLGYSNASAFNRAFVAWEGISPAAWRKK